MTLRAEFNRAVEATREVALNPYLALMKPIVRFVEDQAAAAPGLREFISDLLSIVRGRDFALDSQAVGDFAQTLGEAHFLALSAKKGLTLTKIVEGNGKTPDFEFVGSQTPLHFEIKTLSVAGGNRAIEDTLEKAGEAATTIAEQTNAGRAVAAATTVVSPYGSMKHPNSGDVELVVDTLLEKIRQNIKIEQYSRPNTLLVIDLSLLQVLPGGKQSLRRFYPDPQVENAKVSGVLWMAAFGTPGSDIYEFADFEGKSNAGAKFIKRGVLADSDFGAIRGLLFVSHPWGRPSQIWGLFRSSDGQNAAGRHVRAALKPLVANRWNDDLNTNAAALK